MRRLATLPLLAVLVLPVPVVAQDEPEPPRLLGVVTTADLEAEPFGEWYREERDSYAPRGETVAALRPLLPDIDVTVFFGTWCGDSRREVPRLLRVLDEAGVAADDVRLVAVDRGDGAHKRAPGGEEAGHEVWRVPTVVVSRGGVEIGRVVESPVLSLERDLVAIVSGAGYEPNYRAYPVVRGWLDDGLLADPNVNPRGLARLVGPAIGGEGDLHAAARVLLDRGQVDEAVGLFRVNVALYRDSARARGALAEALLAAGDREGALVEARRALELNADPERAGALADLYASAFAP